MTKSFFLNLTLFCIISANCDAQTTGLMVQDKSMEYNADGFVNSEKVTLSNGNIVITKTIYPNDITIPGNCAVANNPPDVVRGIHYLRTKHVIATPMEVYSKTGNDVTSATLTTYYGFRPYPHYKYAIESPIPVSNFTPVSVSSSGCNLTYSPAYKLQETYDEYDNYGNLLQTTKKGNKVYSAIYGYKGGYCSAIVNNAGTNQIAFTSFEGMGDNGRWVLGGAPILPQSNTPAPFTGRYLYQLDQGIISRANLPSGNYIISYWHRDGTVNVNGTNGSTVTTGNTVRGWTYKEHLINGTTTASVAGTGYIDDLRLYPTSAQMETYTYFPLIGVASKCDAKNLFVFYEYDQLGRVTLIRDQDNKIVKKMEYGLQTAE